MNRGYLILFQKCPRRVTTWPSQRKWPLYLAPELSDHFNHQRRYNSNLPVDNVIGIVSNIYQSISCSLPVLQMQQCLIQIHDYTGLPWWASIIVSTVIFRTFITLPLIIYQQKNVARLENIRQEMPQIATKLKREVSLAAAELKWTKIESEAVYNRNVRKLNLFSCSLSSIYIILA